MAENSSRKLKASRQRDLVLTVIRSTKCHPTADWIFEQARKEMPNISLGTVYRNLKLLRDEGKLKELSFGRGVCRYDGDMRDHYHVRCVECAQVQDVPHVSPRISGGEVEELTGYKIHGLRLEFSGICPQCQDNDAFGPVCP